MRWIVVTIFLWFWLFKGPGNDFLIGSRKEEYVDKHGVMSALFPKMRYQLSRLPGWMLPIGFDRKKHDNYNPYVGSMLPEVVLGQYLDLNKKELLMLKSYIENIILKGRLNGYSQWNYFNN